MRRLDKIIHISNQNHLILKAPSAQINALRIGQAVLDKDLHNIGRIFDIFGPTSQPYISIQPNQGINDPRKYIGEILYCSDEKKTSKRKRSRRIGGY